MLKILVFIFSLFPFIVSADAVYKYGLENKIKYPQTVFTLADSDTSYLKLIIEDNLSIGSTAEVTLTYKNVTVTIFTDEGEDNIPDDYSIKVPDGYYALPENITINDGTIGVVYIYQVGLS